MPHYMVYPKRKPLDVVLLVRKKKILKKYFRKRSKYGWVSMTESHANFELRHPENVLSGARTLLRNKRFSCRWEEFLSRASTGI